MEYKGDNLWAKTEKYAYGGTALQLICNEGPFATLSVRVDCMSDELSENEIVLKNYNENKEISDYCLSVGLVIPTGVLVQVGYVQCPVCKINTDMINN